MAYRTTQLSPVLVDSPTASPATRTVHYLDLTVLAREDGTPLFFRFPREAGVKAIRLRGAGETRALLLRKGSAGYFVSVGG